MLESVPGAIVHARQESQCTCSLTGLISFVFLKPTCRWLIKKGWAKQPFTAQENTVAQTFAMAMTGSSASSAAFQRFFARMLR